MCYRGIQVEDFVFKDENQLQTFLTLSEAGKQELLPSSYYAEDGAIKDCLNLTWNISGEFCGSYMEDHNTIQNAGANRTAWVDKYTTTILLERIFRAKGMSPNLYQII